MIATVYDNATISKTQAFNTESYENGDYILQLDAEDAVGNRTTVKQNVRIANQFPAPKVTGFISNQTSGTISWEFSSGNMDRLQKLQYRIESEDTWHDVSKGNGNQGSFSITIPSQEGICKVFVRGMDTAGVSGKEAAAQCILDQTAPDVCIAAYERGILKGSIQDDYLTRWTVTVTESGTAGTQNLLQGTSEIDNGEIGIISLEQFEAGHTYTLHLTAWDQAGNEQSTSCDFTRNAEDDTVTSKSADFRIIRPNWQDNDTDIFRIPAMETTLGMEKKDGTALEDGTYLWYINNEKVSEGKTLTQDFSTGTDSGYREGTEYSISSVRVNSDGTLSYSRLIIQNQESKQFSIGSDGKAAIQLTDPCVSLILDGDSEDAQGNALTWKIDAGTGTYQTIVPGTRYDIYTLTGGNHLEEGTLNIQVSGSNSLSGLGGVIHADVMTPEFFEVSVTECYCPRELFVKEALNYKTYIKWAGVNTDEEWPESISYEVYRGTTPGFTPGSENLAAEKIQSNYWSEINTNYSERFYYRVRAVKRNAQDEVISTSSFSREISGAVVSSDEYTKRMGVKDYWEYAEAALPNGNVSIEKSAGNLAYTQNDVEIPNEQLEVILSRTYNSQSTVKSAFGIGWNHSFDMEILNLCKDDSLDFETVVLKDGCGTIYYFDRTEDGNYISSMGKYITLKMDDRSEDLKLPQAGTIGVGQEETVTVHSTYTITTKDNVEYRFNSGGQLVYMAEANGNFLLFEYEPNKGLLSKITTSKNISMEFSYNTESQEETDPLTVKKISLPDGSYMEYQYSSIASEWRLTEAVHHGKNGEEIHYRMAYLENGKLSVIYDALGAEYRIGYDGEKVQEFTYPDSEKIRLSYYPEENKTDTEKISDGVVVMTETDFFDSYFGNCVKSVDGEGYVTEYEYKDNLLDTTSTQTSYQTLENGKVVYHTDKKTEKTTYSEDQNVTSEKEEDGSITSYTYNGDAAGEILDDLPKTVKEVDGDGNVLYDNVYEYDEYGNVTSVYDKENNTTILTTYYTEDDPGKGKLKGEVKSEKEILGTAANGDVQSSTSYSYTYDDQGNKTEVVKETLDGITSTTTTITDAMGRILHEDEPGNKQTDYVYDGLGRLVRITCTYSDGTDVIEKRYNDNGALVWEKQQDGTEHSYTYDNMNRVTGEVVTKGNLTKEWTTTYGYQSVSVYDGTGTKTVPHAFVTTEKNPDGYITGQTFQDSNGRTVREISNGIYVDMSYDGQDHVITKCEVGKDAVPQNQLLILYLYDAQGNQTYTLQNPEYDQDTQTFCVSEDTIVTSSAYDASGQTVSQTDGEGNITRFSYDNLGNLTSVELPEEGNLTTYQYDLEKEDGITCDKVIDALGRISETYENERTLTSLIAEYGDQSIDPITLSNEYDNLDRLIKETESAGNYRTYEYDSRDRKTAVHSFNAAGKETLRTVYTYDKRDNVISMSDYQVSDGQATLYHCTKSLARRLAHDTIKFQFFLK